MYYISLLMCFLHFRSSPSCNFFYEGYERNNTNMYKFVRKYSSWSDETKKLMYLCVEWRRFASCFITFIVYCQIKLPLES